MATRIVAFLFIVASCCAQTPIYNCPFTIMSSGNYVLANDIITSAPGACLFVYNASASIDGAGHTITGTASNAGGVWFYNAPSSSLSNIRLVNTTGAGQYNVGHVTVDYSANTLITGITTVGAGTVSAHYSNGTTVQNSTLNGSLQLYYGNNYHAYSNHINIDGSKGMAGAGISFLKTVYAVAYDNDIDGGWNGTSPPGTQGTDNGIETRIYFYNGQIVGNRIRNVFCTGVENAGELFESYVVGNTISTYGASGIGGWWDSSVRGTTFSLNTMSPPNGHQAPSFSYSYVYAQADPNSTVYFLNNTFSDNSYGGTVIYSYGMSINLSPAVATGRFSGGNNVFKNNFLTPGLAMYAQFLGGNYIFSDGGGNRCQWSYPMGGWQLACNP